MSEYLDLSGINHHDSETRELLARLFGLYFTIDMIDTDAAFGVSGLSLDGDADDTNDQTEMGCL